MKKMKERIAKVLCFSMLLVSLASSAVVAAPVTSATPVIPVVLNECTHAWDSSVYWETREIVVNENHQCTICGERIPLYQVFDIYHTTCTKCHITVNDRVPVSYIYAKHPCYN